MARKRIAVAALSMAAGLVVGGAASGARGAALYWNAVPGAASEPGTWDTVTANWNTDAGAAGSQVTFPTDGTGDAVFSAGTTATGAFTVTLGEDISANSVSFEDGTVTLATGTAGTLTIGAGGVAVSNASTGKGPTLNVPLTIGAEQTWTMANVGSSTTVNGLVNFAHALTLDRAAVSSSNANYVFTNGGNTGAGGVSVGPNASATLQIGADSAADGSSGPVGTGTIHLNGGRIESSNKAVAHTLANAIEIDAAAAIGGQSLTGGMTFTGPVTVAASADGKTVTLDDGTGGVMSATFNGVTTLEGNITLASVLRTNANLTTFNGSIGDDAGTSGVGKGITLTGVSTGGKVVLAGANTYSGGTTVKGATLEVTTGNLGLGDVLVTGGTLMLDNASSIADAAGLTVNGTGAVNLNFSGIETVGALTVGTSSFGPGTYSSADLGSAFTGGGQLRVAAVPEPAAVGMLAVGAVVMLRRRRRGGRERVSD